MLSKLNALIEDFLSECLVFGSILILGFFGLLFLFFGDFVKGFQLALALFLGSVIVSFIKGFWYKERPKKLKYNLKILHSSFPSMHSVISTLGFCFGFGVFSSFFWNILLGVLLFLVLLASLVLRRHFVKDVFIGVCLGFVLFLVSGFVVRFFQRLLLC